MYIVASVLGWAELAKLAAVNTLSSPLQDMVYTDNFNLITGADLYRLVSFRFRCADAACKVINDDAGHKAHGPGRWAYSSWDGKPSHHGPADELFANSNLAVEAQPSRTLVSWKTEPESDASNHV